MPITLLHQCGHNANWNIDSYRDDECGDGLILSPVHQSQPTIDKLGDDIIQASIFDPQYYLPNSQKKKLKTYEFFPEVISGGFDTLEFSTLAIESARSCLGFQLEKDFHRIMIPARHFSDMEPDYIEKQEVYTVHPFLQAIEEEGVGKEIFLTLPLTSRMLMHDRYRTNILNWITSYPEIDGVYLLVEDDRASKQIQDHNFLKKYLTSVYELRDAGLKVLVGHCNTEALLFTLIEGCEITFGAYENTRMFSVDKFVVSDEDRRGPRARLYMPGLLNWIQYPQAVEIRDGLGSVWDRIYSETTYAEEAFESAIDPHFNYPGLYKHYFLNFQEQIDTLSEVSDSQRYEILRDLLRNAQENYYEIERWPLDLDRHGRGDHIEPWLDSLNWFYRSFLS
ncbi:MAG: hypothetical protein KZQ93_12100 [Candidatus Thiodiazotropha sp. (ex Monitilora ramsayi)]|nr:hypothetical protein [Candidatus Thiodiazotropha sp. (ex Monitilora ramsayi)]